MSLKRQLISLTASTCLCCNLCCCKIFLQNLFSLFNLHSKICLSETGIFPQQEHSLNRNIPTTGTFPQQEHSHNRNIPTIGTFPQQEHSHNRNIPTTGTFPQQEHSHNRNIPTTGTFPQQEHSHNRNIPTIGTFLVVLMFNVANVVHVKSVYLLCHLLHFHVFHFAAQFHLCIKREEFHGTISFVHEKEERELQL